MRRLVQMLLAVVLLAATAFDARAQGGADQLPTLEDLRNLIPPDLASMDALGDVDFVCQADTPPQGQSFGTDFGTLGHWTTSTCADQTCEDLGGPVAKGRLNICGRGLLEIHAGGKTYVGHFNGRDFAGYWYGSPSCWHAMGPQRYQCEQPLFGDKCWGEIVFQGFEQLPEELRDTGRHAGQVALGYSNRCGLSGKNKRPGVRWAYYDGPYFFWALQDGRE